jgi:phage shock protein C
MSIGGRDGYFRLYRDPAQGWLLGVCAGIAQYFGITALAVRLVTVLGLVFFTLPTVLAYVAAAIVLRPRPAGLYRDRDEERFWTRARVEPRATATDLAARIRALDERLRAAEAYVTSRAFRLRRQFEDLERR